MTTTRGQETKGRILEIKVDELSADARRVLDAVLESSRDNGHDFGIVEDVGVEGMSRQALGGHLTNLEKRGIIAEIYPPERIEDGRNQETITQFVLGAEAIEFDREREIAGQADEVKVDDGAALDSLRDAVRSAIEKAIVAGVDPDDAAIEVIDELAGRGDEEGGSR